MPITSTQVSNIIGGQVGMFSASAQYSQAISAQYGFQPSGSPFPNDPFQQNQMQQNLAMGGGLAQGGIRAGHIGMGAMSTAAMFGWAPRIFDPFTSGMNAFRGGMATGGMMGGLGAGALAFGGVSAGIGAAGWGLNQMMTGAQNRAILTQQAGQMMPGMGVGGLNAVAGQIESMNRQGMGSLQELTGLMRQGANSGALNTSSLSEFTMSFQKLVTNVRQVAQALNTTMSQAQQAMQEVKAMGVSSNNAAGFLGTARAFGAQVGMGPQQMMRMAGMGSSFAANAGIDRQIGATGAITQAGIYGLANRQGIAGVLPDSYGRYMGGASRFLSSRYGRNVLGAMLDTNTGGLDMSVARQISAGGMTRQQINALSRSNIASFGRDAFEASRGELGATFLSEFGPQGLGRTITDMTSGSSNPQQLQKMLTGLTRADLMGMQNLQGQSQRLTQQLVNSAREGFREGQQNQTFSGALKQTWDQLVKPVKDQFRQIGANMTRSMQQAVGQFTGEFARQNHAPGTSYAGGQAAYMRHFRAATMGGDKAFLDLLESQNNLLQPRFDLAPGGPGDDQSMMARLARRLPSAFRIGHYAPGTTWSDLPGGGLGTEEYSGTQTAVALGLRPAGHALGWAGRGVFGAGGRMAASVNRYFPATGFMGMGGRGLIGGTGMGVARATQGLGLVARGLGGLARAAGPAAAVYDFATNQLPAARRRMGYEPVTAGAMMGAQADYTNLLMDTGALEEDEDFKEMDVADFYELEEGARNKLMPVGGFSQAGTGSAGGRQRFLTKQGRDKLIHMQGDKSDAHKRFNQEHLGSISSAQAIKNAAKSISGYADMTDHERVNAITEKLQKEGHARVRPADVVMVGAGLKGDDGRDIFKSATLTQGRFTDPATVRKSTSEALSREMSVHMLRAHAHGSIDLNQLSGEARSDFVRELHETLGADGLKGVTADYGNWWDDGPIDFETGTLDHSKMGDKKFADLFSSADGIVGSQLDSSYRPGSLTGQGRIRADKDAVTGGGGKYGLRRAWQAGLSDLIIGADDGVRSQAVSAVKRFAEAGRNQQQKHDAIQELRDALTGSADPVLIDAVSGKIGGTSARAAISNEDWEQLLTQGPTGFGDSIMAEQNARDQNNYTKTLARRRRMLTGDEGANLDRGIREAMFMSGGNSFSRGAMKEVMTRYYSGAGSENRLTGGRYSASMDVAARQQFMDQIAIRLRPEDYNGGGTEEINAARLAGGRMTMKDLDRLSAELLEESDVGLQDMGQVAANMARFRRAARTNDGMGKGRDQVEVAKRVLGIKLGKDSATEDKRYLRGEAGSVMSTHLEEQLRTAARGALEAASPGANITDEMINERVGQYTSALRADGARGRGYEALNRVINTQGAPTDPNSAAPSGRDGSSTAANLSKLETQVSTFTRLVGNMNTAMSEQQGGSDIRIKRDITLVGQSPSGIPLYTFRYKNDPEGRKYNGAMAQDLLKILPEAVSVGEDNYYRVDYSLLDVGFYQINEGSK